MSPTSAPVRRSPLDAVHRQLGGTWPRRYEDAAAERDAVAGAIGLAEPGFTDVWIVRGRRALVACRSAGLDARAGAAIATAAGNATTWAIADDEAWLVADAPGNPAATDSAATDGRRFDAAPVLARLAAANATVIDVSSGWTRLVVAGPRVRDLLEELVVSDLGADVVADRAILQVPIANCRVVLARTDLGATPAFTLLVARDEAEFLWDTLTHLGEPYGLRPVGSDALGPATGGGTSAPALAPAGAGATS